ncbi:acyl carrier protein [Streptomyces sp. MP131-18]|uniref:acyl carrier protein n=1 Tax=Streptomyces sp. MP131-18 TaxID=1857892 RepID=UPI00097CBC7F|nr:acyl carrier protein [Streptomyces sp. MP131-18]ONK12122.1 Phosphopantetheine attachment site [Streptomyces sp. MP131-18]
MPASHLSGDDPQHTDALVLSIVDEVTGRGPLRPTDSFYDIGGTSLDAIRICLRVGREAGVEVGPEDLLGCDDLADFIALVSAARTDR